MSVQSSSRKLSTRRAFAAVFAGALLPLALAPFDLFPLMFVSAGALFWLLCRTPTPAGALLVSWLFGLGKYGIGASWVYVSIHEFEGVAALPATLYVAGFVAAMALFCAGMGLAFRLLVPATRPAPSASIIAFTAVWVGMEWALTWAFTGFPWLFAGYAFMDTPLAGLAPVGGVLSMSTVAVLTSACVVSLGMWAFEAPSPTLGHTPHHPKARLLNLMSPLVLWLVAWALQAVPWTTLGEERSVALVQANVPQSTKWLVHRLREWLDRYREMTLTVADADIVVWPEAAIPINYQSARPFTDEVVASLEGDLVQGAPLAMQDEDGTHSLYNAAVSSGGGTYLKSRLVPFGEYTPFTSSGIVAGEGPQPHLTASGITLGTAICYEVAYGQRMAAHARGADALVTVTNDTWFGRSIGPLQHAQIARMRAIENGKYLMRATNNGVTAIFDHQGMARKNTK